MHQEGQTKKALDRTRRAMALKLFGDSISEALSPAHRGPSPHGTVSVSSSVAGSLRITPDAKITLAHTGPKLKSFLKNLSQEQGSCLRITATIRYRFSAYQQSSDSYCAVNVCCLSQLCSVIYTGCGCGGRGISCIKAHLRNHPCPWPVVSRRCDQTV
jgi:hypothetical protein